MLIQLLVSRRLESQQLSHEKEGALHVSTGTVSSVWISALMAERQFIYPAAALISFDFGSGAAVMRTPQ